MKFYIAGLHDAAGSGAVFHPIRVAYEILGLFFGFCFIKVYFTLRFYTNPINNLRI